MTAYFRRTHHDESLRLTYAGGRVVVVNPAGNVMLNCSLAVFAACWDRGYFVWN